jgi:outer membrane protein W
MKRLLYYCCLFALLAACTKNADAQDSCTSHCTKKQDWVIGYATGEQLLLGNSKTVASTFAFTNTISADKNINDNWAVEFELNVSAISKQTNNKIIAITNGGTCKEYNVTVPVTFQYYFLPKETKKECRISPYVGAGVQYNVFQQQYNEYDFSDGSAKRVTSTKANTSYASFVITQGVTYDISPKIQLKESIHFIPKQNSAQPGNLLGVSMGIGFKF